MSVTDHNRVRGAEGATVVAPALSSNDPRLTQAVEEYQALLRAGETPDRQAFLNRDPAIAEALADCLDALDFIHGAASGLQQLEPGADASPSADEARPTVPLGDYQIVRQVGQGGMGVVYEAVQLSLGRRVALKVLPFASALDSRQLQRFKHEAQTAGQLHHPHIVPIYAVGYERGVHYYAMQFIEGKTLAAFVDVLRQSAGLGDGPLPPTVALADKQPSHLGEPDLSSTSPDPPIPLFVAPPETAKISGLGTERSIKKTSFVRAAAELCIQAAEALEYAHQVGVVHRDIKPANLMVDLQGKLWITDFGLARFQDNPQLTVTGDVVGTWRYMSPEQALAKRMLIEHRTDIYSLGITLYELLTLTPAFDGQDRQELLRQIGQDDPVPPRRLNDAIPVELETIILKSVAKRPEERYGTAQELADDLRRFLEDKPVLAQRPSLREKAVKWTRRHRPIVAVAAAMLVLAVVFLGLSTALFYERNLESRRAKEQLQKEAERAGLEADHARQSQQQLQAEQVKLTEEKAKLSKNLKLAVVFLEKFTFTALTNQSRIGRDAQTRREVQNRLRDIRAFYKEFDRVNRSEPTVRQLIADGYQKVGDVEFVLGELKLSRNDYDQSLALLKDIVAEQPNNFTFRFQLADCYFHQAQLLLTMNLCSEAEHGFHEAMEVCQALTNDFPRETGWKPFWILKSANARHQLSNLLLSTGRAEEAEKSLRESLPVLQTMHVRYGGGCPPTRYALAECQAYLGSLLKETGRAAEAEQHYEQARRLLEVEPYAQMWRIDLVRVLFNIGIVKRMNGGLPAALDTEKRALDLLRKLAKDSPGEPHLQMDLSTVQHQLGLVYQSLGRFKEAEETLGQALETIRPLTRDYPANQNYQVLLGICLTEFGVMVEHAEHFDDAEKSFREAAEILEKLVGNYPGIHGYQSVLGTALANWARMLYRRKQVEESSRLLERAIAAQEAAIKGNPSQPHYRAALAKHYLDLATVLVGTGQHAEAATWADKLVAVRPESADDVWAAAKLLADCANLAGADVKLDRQERQALEERYAEGAKILLPQAERRCAKQPAVQNNFAWLLAHRAPACLRDPPLAVRLAEQAVHSVPDAWSYVNTLGTSYYRAGRWRAAVDTLKKGLTLHPEGDGSDFFFLAMAHWQLGDKKEARQWYGKGLTWLQEKQPDAEMKHFRDEAANLLGVPVLQAANNHAPPKQ